CGCHPIDRSQEIGPLRPRTQRGIAGNGTDHYTAAYARQMTLRAQTLDLSQPARAGIFFRQRHEMKRPIENS
ncbi:hypothetical protein ACNRBS_16340, partial [Ralstonia pseudosolanacearum]|uniref:hypothetical protein n=1 Tax=Ralstonia pseudosolanacearum TaxID=1310165 RepID=UPI003AAAE250